MRVMVLVKANEDSERGDYSGHEEEFAAMGKYNEELLKSGIMLAGEGLTPSSDGQRVAFGEDGENCGEAEASGIVGNMIDLDPESAERGGLCGRGEGPAKDEQI